MLESLATWLLLFWPLFTIYCTINELYIIHIWTILNIFWTVKKFISIPRLRKKRWLGLRFYCRSFKRCSTEASGKLAACQRQNENCPDHQCFWSPWIVGTDGLDKEKGAQKGLLPYFEFSLTIQNHSRTYLVWPFLGNSRPESMDKKSIFLYETPPHTDHTHTHT